MPCLCQKKRPHSVESSRRTHRSPPTPPLFRLCPQFSNAFGDGARLGWDCSLSGSPLTGTQSSNCHLLYTYDLGSGSVASVPFAGERDVAWHGEAKVQWAEDLEKPPKRQIEEESGGSKAKKAKTEDGAAAAADGDSTKDNFIGKAFPMLEQQVTSIFFLHCSNFTVDTTTAQTHDIFPVDSPSGAYCRVWLRCGLQ